MNELNEEIKQTINLMQAVNDACVYSEMQDHLKGLLEIKRNELQQRLVERSWLEPVTHDQAPYKSVKLEGQVEAKPLTTEDLKVGGWWCADVSEECRLALVGIGINTAVDCWDDNARDRCALMRYYGSYVARSDMAVESDTLKQIHRISNEFYWSEK